MNTDTLTLAERVEAAEASEQFELLVLAWDTVNGSRVEALAWDDPKRFEQWIYDRRSFNALIEAGGYLDAAMTLYVRVPERVPSDPRKATAEALRQRAEAV